MVDLAYVLAHGKSAGGHIDKKCGDIVAATRRAVENLVTDYIIEKGLAGSGARWG